MPGNLYSFLNTYEGESHVSKIAKKTENNNFGLIPV